VTLTIEDEEIERLAAMVARLIGAGEQEAVRAALREKLERLMFAAD
jgi:hypothetical protein